MTTGYVPELDPSIVPADESGLQSLFVLARVLRPRLAKINREPGALKRVIDTLGLYSKAQLGKTGSASDLLRAWAQFFNDVNITSLPKELIQSLETAQDESRTLANDNVELFREDLAAAHQKAHAFVLSMLESNGLKALSPKPALLRIVEDHAATRYCAATNRLKYEISWAHQPVKHALHGALLAELVIAHEYFSHLVARNPYLDRSIPEGWLNVGLLEWFERYGDPEPRAWMRRLWLFLCDALRDHLVRQTFASDTVQSQAAMEGIYGVKEFAISLYGKSSPIFWKLTGEILKVEETSGSEMEMARFLEAVVADGARWKEILIKRKWEKIKDLYSYI